MLILGQQQYVSASEILGQIDEMTLLIKISSKQCINFTVAREVLPAYKNCKKSVNVKNLLK